MPRKGEVPYNRLNLAGRRFGRLTVLEYHDSVGTTVKVARWLCRCDCGEMKVARRDCLVNNRTMSCGCLQAETRKRRRHILQPGQRFGRLTVIRETGKLDGFIMVKCACDCGKTTITRMGNLTANHTRSCGCLRKETQRLNALKGLHRIREVRAGIKALAEITEILGERE